MKRSLDRFYLGLRKRPPWRWQSYRCFAYSFMSSLLISWEWENSSLNAAQ